MSVIMKDGQEKYQGCVLAVYMQDEPTMDGGTYGVYPRADVWDSEQGRVITLRDHDFTKAERDAFSRTVEDAVIDSFSTSSNREWDYRIEAAKRAIKAGVDAVVVRGRKIKKGTKLHVFWTYDRADYTGWHTETIAGCFDEDGRKVWIRADYLQRADIERIEAEMEESRKIMVYRYSREKYEAIINKDGTTQY